MFERHSIFASVRARRVRRTLALVVCFSALLSCRGKPKRLEVPPGCPEPEVVRCLQDYAYERLSSRDIKRLIGEGVPSCLSRDQVILSRRSDCFPLDMGKDDQGRMIALVFRCEDMCADRGDVVPMYVDSMSPEACCDGGGYAYPLFNASMAYGGCGPPEILSEYEKLTGKPAPNLFCNKLKSRRAAPSPRP